jgi:hypothetical protein
MKAHTVPGKRDWRFLGVRRLQNFSLGTASHMRCLLGSLLRCFAHETARKLPTSRFFTVQTPLKQRFAATRKPGFCAAQSDAKTCNRNRLLTAAGGDI